jgi:hypothetical protein
MFPLIMNTYTEYIDFDLLQGLDWTVFFLTGSHTPSQYDVCNQIQGAQITKKIKLFKVVNDP